MQAADYADEVISDVTENFPYLQGNSVIVMALVRVCGQVLELKGAAEIAQEPRGTLRVGETTPAFPSPGSGHLALPPCIRGNTAEGPDYCKTCSDILREWVQWQGHTGREANLIKSLEEVLDEYYL